MGPRGSLSGGGGEGSLIRKGEGRGSLSGGEGEGKLIGRRKVRGSLIREGGEGRLKGGGDNGSYLLANKPASREDEET